MSKYNDQVKEIRFITPGYDELFRIPDGSEVFIDYEEHPDRSHTAKCEYIDDYHARIGFRIYHICEFAEIMQRNGAVVKPAVKVENA